MTGDFEDALRRRVEEAVDLEVEHLRCLLELRLTALVREVLAERLPSCKRPGPASPGLESHRLIAGRQAACRDDDGNHIGGA